MKINNDGTEDGTGDAELLEKICKADHSSFRILVERYSRICYRLAFRILHRKDLSEDVVQDVMIKIWNQPDLWDSRRGAKFSTWLYRVVVNAAIDQYRRNKDTVAVENWDVLVDKTESSDREIEMSKLAAELAKKMHGLSINQQTALVLCRLEGMSHKDAGEVMDITPKAVERCIDKGIGKLRDGFARDNVDIQEVFNY